MADSEDELPPERDVKDFTFKQMRKIRMFEAPRSLPTPRCNLLAVSSKYGLTFVGCLTGLKVIKTETIERIHDSDEGSMQNVVTQCPSSYIDIGHTVQFVGLSCDNLTLSVCYENGNNTVMALYDVPTLGTPNNSKAKFCEITLNSDSGVSIVNLVWNPGVPGLFAVCVSSGSVLTMELTDTQVKTLATLPASIKASAICWSPKGKQLVVGHKDGRLTQYSQVLQVKKEIDCPELFTDDPHLVADVLWITSTLFAAVFSSFEEGDTPKLQLISTPKNEPVTITNFDDIYYVMSEERQPVFYMRNLSEWSLVLSACSNGLEAAVIGKYGGEAPLEKWSFEEDGRPVMPLTNDNDDTFPMGLEIDFSSTRQIAKGEDRLPPAPIMMILSTDGVLCPFYMLNQTPNVNHTIVKPPEPLPLGGQRKPVVSGMNDMSQATGGFGPAEKGPLQPVPVSLGTSANLPVGAFSFASAKQTIPAAPSPVLSGLSGNVTLGAFSIGSSKQPSGTFSSGTPASNSPSAFSFASPKQAVPSASGASSGMTVGAPASAFSVTGQKSAGLTAFKPPQSQVPGAELVKPSTTPQLVKPTPTSQTQPGLAVGPGVSSFQSPGPGANAGTAKPVAQGFSLGGDRPKAISSTPSQVAGQGIIAQPKPTPAQPPVTVTKPPAVRLQPQSEKSASSGFKLPGQSTDTTDLTRRELTKKAASVSNDDVIEASVSKNIREAISHFNEEMVRLRASVKAMQSKCCLTNDDKDLHTLRKTTDEIGSSLAEIRVVTKDQHKDIDEEKRKLLDSFEMMEDARIRNGRKNDPRYVQLLKSRALDPMNKNKMRDIRHLHSHLDKTLREVNMVLDVQWNKENECKKSIQRPALDEIFQTLRINQKIAQDQGAKLEKITEEMENRKLLSTSWQRNSVNTSSVRDDVSSMSNPFAVPKGGLKSPSQRSPVPVSPEKQTQLRSMFQKRRNTPVRRSMIVPSTVTKTPTVKPSKSQVPCFSSTPAANPVATAEKNKNSIRFNLSIAQEEEDYYAGGDGSLPEEGEAEGDEPQENEQELEQLSAVSKVSSSGPASSGAFSLSGGSTFVPAVSVSGKDVLSALAAKDDGEVKKSTAQSVRSDVAVGSQARPTSQPTATGAFSSVVKPAGSQAASATTQAEPSKASGGLFLPGAAKPSSATAAPSKSDLTSGVKVISTETPPNIAAAMAAMSRANATQSAVQPSSSNLDPSASIEPVTLVAYKPQGGAQTKDQDAENTAAKAIANAALMAATAEAQKLSTKPQCSTEFIFKSTDSGKPGPPVVTFKPPNSSSQTSETGFTVAPNVTVFKPAFAPAVPNSSAVSNTGGLQPSLTGTQVASPFSQVTTSSVPFSFATPPGGFNFSPSSGTSTFGSKGGDTKTANQIPALSVATVPTAVATGTTASTTAVGITPSPRVSRNLFASGDVSSQAAPTDQQQDKSKESSVQVTTVSSSFASSTGITTSATAPFSFSAPAPSSGGFFKNLSLSSNVGSAFGSSNVDSGSTSILNALMRSSDAGNSSNLFAAVPTTVPSDAAPPPLPKATPSENRDAKTTTLSTPSSVSVPGSAGGVFAQALSESSKPSVVPSASTIDTLPSTTGIFGAVVTTTASTSGGLFGLPSTTSVTAPSAIAATSNLFGLSAGSPSSAFSATSTASPFFSINPASTKPSAPLGSSPSSSSTAATTSTAQGSSTSAASGLFGKVTSTTSAFGAVSTAGSSGFGSLGTAATTSAGGGLFGSSTSPAFAPTSVFGTSSGGSTFGSSQAFSSPVSSQGSTFGSAPVFGSANTTAGTGSMFGASLATSKPAFGQSSFPPTTSAGFSQAASKPAENALGFGFSGFGLGGQGSSQTAAKTNPFGIAQEFSTTATSQSSLFGGKSGADIFKASNTSKPAFGSGPFSQSGFGSQSSSGFSGGSFSSQGGSVQASGFGFGAASSTGSSTGFGSSQPFGSPSAGDSVFGGAPAFGSSSSFGAAPAFGGSPQRGLGATPSQGIFGSSGGFGQSSGSPTFGSLASQSSVPTFGSIAGQSPTPQGFGSIQPQQQHQHQHQHQSSPSFGSFGGGSQSPSGVSFSQWR